MSKKIFKILFYSCLIVLSLNANELIKKPNSPIIDIGYTQPQKSYSPTIAPDWVYYSTLTRITDKLIQTKERILSEKYDCETDYLGRENCSIQQTDCTAQLQQDDGIAVLKKKTITVNKIRKETSTNISNTIEGDRLIPSNLGAYTGTLFTLKYGSTGFYNPQQMFNDGYQKDGKFAMKMFNFGSGWGIFAIFPIPNKVSVIQNKGAILNIGSTASVWPNALISTPDATFATILVEWNNIPSSLSYSCDDYCMISKPTNVLGITNWECPETFVDADGIKSESGKCKKEYSYYEYKCKTDTNNYDRPWIGPVKDAGGDCQGQCGPYGCVCNSPTPPKNNCVRDDFKCPFDESQLCTITTDDKSSIDNIINGYVYEAGNAQTFKNTVEKDKSCPNGLTWNKDKDICEDTVKYDCLKSDYYYDDNLGECIKPIECKGTMVNGKCVEEPSPSCEDGYTYNKSLNLCTAVPICDKGIYHTVSNLCEEKVVCPVNFKFNEANRRCEKLMSYESLTCNIGKLKDGTPNYCQTDAILTTATYSGEASKTWYMCDSCLSTASTRDELLAAFKEIVSATGGTTATLTASGANYVLNHNSKKPINLSLSSGGSVNVPAGTSITVRKDGVTVGGTALTGVKPVLMIKASISCGSSSVVPASGDYPSYTKCNDVPGKWAKCPNGYQVGYIGVDAVCYKPPTCTSGFELSSDGMSCVKNLVCEAGYLADYRKNACVKIESGYEMNLANSIYIYNIDCIGGVNDKGICSYISTCKGTGKLDVEIDKCVVLPEFSCPDDVTAKCAEGSYYKNGKCLSIPTCPKGTKYDYERNVCGTIGSCSTGFTYNSDSGKCEKVVPSVSYSCLAGEVLLEGEVDVCRIVKNGACPTGYKVSLNASYCERSIVCPSEYPNIDYVNNKCFKGE